MEFIQWQVTSPAESNQLEINEPYTRNAIFRLDELDQEMFDKDAVEQARKETEEFKSIGAIAPDCEHTSLHITADTDLEFKLKCLNTFSYLLGLNKIM